jgi:hypothetical protein
MERSDAKGTVEHFSPDKVLIALVGFGMGDVTDRAEVHLARFLVVCTPKCQKFSDWRGGREDANPISGT